MNTNNISLDGLSYKDMPVQWRSFLPPPDVAGRDINRFVWDSKSGKWIYDWLGE